MPQKKYPLLALGRTRLMLCITALSILIAVGADILIVKLFQHDINYHEDLLRAAIIPLFIAPIISWYFLGLLYEIEALQLKMARHANHDDLTGLLNRRGFFNACYPLHELTLRNNQPYSILALDLDHFKLINDKHGHHGGDLVLKNLGEIAREISRKSDIIGRLGGEEFYFLLSNTDLESAKNFSFKLLEIIRNINIIHGNSHIQYTASLGIATNIPSKYLTLEETLKNADSALYHAKASGRNQLSIYQSD